MTTIAKTSKKARALIENARAIKCYSLSNCFTGKPIVDNPSIWGEPKPGDNFRPLVEVTQTAFLRHELESMRSTKLRENGDGTYTIDVHSNLWYQFESYAGVL